MRPPPRSVPAMEDREPLSGPPGGTLQIWAPADGRHDPADGRLLDAAVRVDEMQHRGASGALIQRLTLKDGTTLVMKAMSPEWDWMMRATRDKGRAALLWTTGVMDRLPPEIDPLIVRIEREGPVFRLYMRDLAPVLPKERDLPRESAEMLPAMIRLHEAFWETPVEGLCTLTDLLAMASPAAARQFSTDEWRERMDRGWGAFESVVPRDIVDVVARVRDCPAVFATSLEAEGCTLIHADLHPGNAIVADGRVMVFDWSLATWAPPAVDFAWFLAHSFIPVDQRDGMIEAFRTLEGERHSPRALDLSAIAQLVNEGWGYGLGSLRGERLDEANFWADRARVALDRWQPEL